MIIKASGDLGDWIFGLCVARNIAKGCDRVDLMPVDSEFMPNSPLFMDRFHLVSKLTEAQPYVNEVLHYNGKCDFNLLEFRGRMDRTRTLVHAQIEEARRVKNPSLLLYIDDDTSPWLEGIEPHPYSWGRVVIARSHRYRNHMFPWREILDKLGDRLLFIGHREEHRDFESMYGWVEYCPTEDLYDAASLIKGADLFIGNQSSPMACAIGLGAPFVQEVSPIVPDCIYLRANAQYVTDKGFQFEGHQYGPKEIKLHEIRTMETPPGQWQWQGEKRFDLDALVKFFYEQDKSVDKRTLRNKILIANVLRQQGFFNPTPAMSEAIWAESFQNAGIK